MNRWKFIVIAVSIMASVTAFGKGICPGDLYPNKGGKCYPCLGCKPCCDTCTDYCDDPSVIVNVGYTQHDFRDIRILESIADLDLDTTSVDGEFRPRRFTFTDSWLVPSFNLGIGRGDARLTLGDLPRDGDVTIVRGGAGLHWSHWNRWGSDLDVQYRKTTGGETLDFSSVDASLSVRYGIVPDRLTAWAGVRATHGEVTVEPTARETALGINSVGDHDDPQVTAGVEYELNDSLSANVQIGSGSESRFAAFSLRYGIGRGRPVASGIANGTPVGPVELGCVWRGGRFCNADGFNCLVMFPEDEWLTARPQFGGAASVSGRGEVIRGAQPVLRYEFTSEPSTAIPAIEIEREVSLSASASRALGYANVTVLPGRYSVDPRLGPFGGIVYNVSVCPR